MKHGIWITWEIQRRNKGLSSALGWPLYEIVYDESRISRYIKSSVKTVKIILKDSPQIVTAQNPSIVLALLVTAFKYILKYRAIIDSHSGGIYPLEGGVKLLMAVSKWLQKHADLTLVTNEKLKSVVESNGGRAFVIPDKIPSVPQTRYLRLNGRHNIAYICKFREDEPYEEVIKAAKLISKDIFIYFTGNYESKMNAENVPKNVELLGFIPEHDFWSLLKSADVIMDLTLREGCLVCGAYEGISVSKPLILSKTEAIVSYFNKGCVFVQPTCISIASGIQEALEKLPTLKSQIKMLRLSLEKHWSDNFKGLRYVINLL